MLVYTTITTNQSLSCIYLPLLPLPFSQFRTIVRHVRPTEAMADVLLAKARLVLHALPRVAMSYCGLL